MSWPEWRVFGRKRRTFHGRESWRRTFDSFRYDDTISREFKKAHPMRRKMIAADIGLRENDQEQSE